MHTAAGTKTSEAHLKHREDFQRAKEARKLDEHRAKLVGDVVVCAVDLQKALPCPYITIWEVYYLRQCYCYNCGIHIDNDNSACMCMWGENVAGRGASEKASCILWYFENHSYDAIDELIVWTDSCAGQNKNKYVVALWFLLHALRYFSVFRQKFPEVGHSLCSYDRDFGLIEKAARRTENKLIVPSDQMELAKNVRANPYPFEVQ